MDTQSLELSKWNCKYHLLCAPKYSSQEIYGIYGRDYGVSQRKKFIDDF